MTNATIQPPVPEAARAAGSSPSSTAASGQTGLNLPRNVIIKKLYGRALPVMKPLVISTICSVIQNLLGVALFVVGAHGVATVATHAGIGAALPIGRYVWLLVGLALAKALFRYLEQYAGHYVAFTALEQLRLFLFSRIWPQAPALSASSRTGDLLARVTRDIDRIEVFFAHTIAPAISAFLVPLVVVVFVSVSTTPVLGLAAFVFLLFAAFAVPFIGGSGARDTAADVLRERGQNLHHVTETIQGVREIVGFDYGARRQEELAARSQQIATRAGRAWWTVGMRRAIAHAVQLLAAVPLIIVGAEGVRSGQFTLVDFLPAIIAVVATFPAVRGVEDVIADLDKATASADRLFTLADTVPVVSEPENPVRLGVNTGEAGPGVEFDAVTFTYPSTEGRVSVRPAAQEISLLVEPGTRLALVGASGAGKSTLVQLLLRFWDVDSGAVRINGINVRDVSLAELRDSVAIVTQATHMFNMSIAENLRLARPAATDADIVEACSIACLADDIAAFPDGVQTRVGELGDNLSGGQRQRLSLARALLSGAKILVLDEFTSHLDEATAARVRANLASARPGVTVIEITHRVSDALDADTVAVIREGMVAEYGKPSEVAASGGLFARMLEAGHA
ncbi:ABC transporter ATP-binding protein [Populibacterium corticicola]|uniref:ABC transporter ATP-binding protein n=1 Tax=Populibacterium corticicola TaxID=1812826 RepID=A0ABW5XD75_9MICO